MPLRIYRRRLPHWRVEGATYFVTWCLQNRREGLAWAERDIVVTAIRHFESIRYRLEAYVIMDDHVHVMVTPSAGHELEEIVHTWKSFSANQLQRRTGRAGRVWQGEYHDWIVRSEREYGARVRYILANPRRRWPGITIYRWAWCRGPDGAA